MSQSPPTPLLFGNDSHVTHVDPGAWGASMSMLWRHLQNFDVPAGQQGFSSRTASLQLPGMSFLAAAVSSVRIDVADNARTLIAFPVHGRARLRIQGRKFEWGGAGCLFVPAGSGPQQIESIDQNVLVLQIDQHALENAARAVLGLEREQSVDLGFDDPRILTSCLGSSPAALARHIGATIDPHARNPHLLHRLGVQDFIYRQLVLLFRPDWRAATQRLAHGGGPHRRRAIDRVCDALLADLHGHYTVNDLALLGGMSVRALQYAFKSRFGHSPMQWLRDQRLQHMRQRLLDGTQGSIAQMALDCGFATASGFSAFYRRRYGETPAATRAKRC
jgi:AraC-like DNA-binding protein